MNWLNHPMLCLCSPRFASQYLRFYSTQRPPALRLRPYQENALQACTEALQSGSTRVGVSLPTGSGKTTVFITLLSRIKPSIEYPDATRSLVIVNNIELARQSAKQAQQLFAGWSVEIEQGQKHKASGKADLCVSSCSLFVLWLTSCTMSGLWRLTRR